MFTLAELNGIKSFLEILSKLNGAYKAFRGTRSTQVDLSDVVEKYFAFEGLPNNKVSFTGILSPYTIASKYPVYSPRDIKEGRVEAPGKDGVGSIEFRTAALNVPALAHNNINLDDGSKAKVIWLYPPESNGLVFNTYGQNEKGRNPLSTDNLSGLFKIENNNRPIPVLVDLDFATDEFYFTRVKMTGRFVTAPLHYFDELSATLNPFFLNFYSNSIRPFSSVEGVLAIDIRKPNGSISKVDNEKKPFRIIYSVQGLVNIPEESAGSKAIILSSCIEGIPDRQGIPLHIKSITDGSPEKINSIISIGSISWQYSEHLNTFGAFIELEASNSNEFQTKITKLAHHWSVFQSKATELVTQRFGIPIDIMPLVCSNSIHKKVFSSQGLQITKKIESALLDESPIIRNGIDWLGISIGRE